MTSTQDRRTALSLVNEARDSGARLAPACATLGIGVNTYRRWTAGVPDRRPEAQRPAPHQKLSSQEREAILKVCHEPAYASLPPAQIVARLLDEQGVYLASEASFYRILRKAHENQSRGRAAAPRPTGPPSRHCAQAANQVWSWDVTYLPTRIRGHFLYLYLIVDLYSRKIVGGEVFEAENTGNSESLIRRTLLRERCQLCPPVLHADNGSAMKGSSLRATLEKLGVIASHSRPRVSNDNAFSEALFRTCKYRPDYPSEGFEDLCEARGWVDRFVHWYNEEHRHSAIRFVTPSERHQGQDAVILQRRDAIYRQAQQKIPSRWSGSTRNWTPIGEVWLNPDPQTKEVKHFDDAA
jgi:putative transposase